MLKIITDSATDMPESVRKEFQLHVIPTPVVINGKDYFDGETIHTKEFYELLEQPENIITTYHINPQMFEEAFTPYAERGDSVIYLCFSTGIAGTFNAANLAKQAVLEKYPDFDLTIIDSKAASIGFGLIVYKLLVMQRNGASKELLIEAADFYIHHIRHVVTVRTLHYLIKGGRLGKFKGAIGETLDMKPIIIVDEAGSLKVLQTVRGRKKSIRTLVQYVKEHAYEPNKQLLAFCHGEDEEALAQLLTETKKEFPDAGELIATVGCAIGAHTGRGILGICFFDASEEAYLPYLTGATGTKV